MAMSNMNKNRNNAKVTDKQSAKNQSGKKFYEGEFGSEFDFDGASAQANNFPEARREIDNRQPVSERTAWH